jgi:ELWxxDGT repeat protein
MKFCLRVFGGKLLALVILKERIFPSRELPMKKPRAKSALLAATLLFANLCAAQVSLLADLNTGPNGANGRGTEQLLPVSAVKTYFVACDDESGCEVWKTDGSTAGTVRITDICPGQCGSQPAALTLIGSTVYLSADDGQRGEELWKVDINTDTASLVRDIQLGAASSSPRQFTAANNADGLPFVYFSMAGVNEASGRNRVGRIDAAGNFTVTDTGLNWEPQVNWVAYNGAIYGVTALPNTGDFELTKITLGSFVVSINTVKDIEPGAASSRISRLSLGLSPLKLLFGARSLASGFELYASDGTAAGTTVIQEQAVGTLDSFCSTEVARVGALAYFSARISASSGCELHRTDGTAAGTVLVKDIFPGNTGSDPTNIKLLGTNLIFTAIDSTATGRELWKSDGTAAGTVLIRDLIPGAQGILFSLPTSSGRQPSIIANGFYYVLSDTASLYRTDGSSAGTREVGTRLGDTADFRQQLSSANGVIIYTAIDLNRVGAFGFEPVRAPISNPSINELLKNIGSDVGNSFPDTFVDFNGRVVFPATVSSRLPVIHITSPSSAPIVINPDFVNGLTSVSGNKLYMRDFSGLQVSDGTAAGLITLSPEFNNVGAFLPTSFGAYFLAKTRDIDNDGELDSQDGFDLWRTDGTEAGTVKITSRQTLADSFFIDGNEDFVLLGNEIFVAGFDSANFANVGDELYRINVTSGTASLVRDIAPGTASSFPSNFLQVGNQIFFTARESSGNEELWKSDGTAQGTVQVADLNPAGGSFPRSMVKVGNSVYFTAFNATAGRDVYQTDGTTTTVAAAFTVASDTVSGFGRLTVSGNRVYFAGVSDIDNGARLYYTTGTVASMRQLGNISAAAPGNAPQNIIAGSAPGSVIFSAWDAANGRELWYSDGTDAGTRRVSNIAAGARSSSPTALALVRSRVYFAANDQLIGREPYVLDLEQLDRFFSNGFE